MNPRLRRREALRLCAGAAAGAVSWMHRAAIAQASNSPEFDVSTVKLSNPASGATSGIRTGYGRLDAENVTLKRCIIGAYEVGPQRVVGGPDWIDAATFDIAAKSDQGINDDHVLNMMLQRLLADRFRVVLHHETRTLSAYVLEVDKKGPKLQPAKGGDSSTNSSTGSGRRVTIEASNTDMDLFATVLARQMSLPVVNQTALKGKFDFKLRWLPEDAPTPLLNGSPDPNAPPGIFTALQEQLGLRLRSTKAPVDVLAVDHAERPTPD